MNNSNGKCGLERLSVINFSLLADNDPKVSITVNLDLPVDIVQQIKRLLTLNYDDYAMPAEKLTINLKDRANALSSIASLFDANGAFIDCDPILVHPLVEALKERRIKPCFCHFQTGTNGTLSAVTWLE